MSTSTSSVQITRFRLSLIWAETVLDLLNADKDDGASFTFHGFKRSYIDYFDTPLTTGETNASKVPTELNEPIGLSLPWSGHVRKNHFWRSMLEREEHDTSPVAGKDAWRALIPLRGAYSTPNALWWPGSLELTPFFYPFGIGLVLTAEWQPPEANTTLSLDGMVKAAFKVYRDGKFEMEALPSHQKDMSANALATNMLISLRKTAFGETAHDATRVAGSPFSVLTILEGQGVKPQFPTPFGGAVHRALEGVTYWDPNYDVVQLHHMNEDHVARLRHNGRALSDLVFMGTRGRAVWFPRWFIKGTDNSLRTLSCYHDNLVAASLHVDSLSGFLRETATSRRNGRSLASAHVSRAKLAGGIIARLSGGKLFRSWSPRAQIEQNGFLDDINYVRNWLVESQAMPLVGAAQSPQPNQ